MAHTRRLPHVRESTASYHASSVDERNLQEITRRIVRAAHPKMVILFGSRAYGKPRPDSDIDLLIVMDKTGSHPERTQALRQLFSHLPLKLDIHARTPDELTSRLEMGDAFIQEIVGHGRQMYPVRAVNGFAARTRRALRRGKLQPKENDIVVQEWVEIAEGDFEGARMWARRSKNLRPEKLCWDCQQCVEKYLKAFLTRQRIHFDRTHKLAELLTLCQRADADFRLIKNELDTVDICQPQIRYPGALVTEAQARAAFAACKTIRTFTRAKLGLR